MSFFTDPWIERLERETSCGLGRDRCWGTSYERGLFDANLQLVVCCNPMANPQDIETIIRNIVRKLVVEYAPMKVILFGSHVGESPGPDSDIDLLIIKETSERFIDRWVEVQGILTGIHQSIPLETLVLTPDEIENRLAVGDQFISEILEKGEILYAA